MRARRAGAALALLALAGCGSTVQVTGIAAGPTGLSPDGLGTAVQQPTGEVPLSTGETSAPGTTTGLPGGGSSPPGSGTVVPGRSSSTTGPLATVAPPSTKQTGPVEIGFVNTSTGNADSAGIDTGQTYSTDKVFRSLVSALNVRGGLAGRKIVPVTADSDTAAADWNTQFQAACSTFTQDHHVAAVVGYVFGFFDAFEACLAKAGVVHLHGGYTVGDKQDLSRYPGLYATSALTADRRYLLQVQGAVTEGWLTKSSKLGLIVDQCANDQRAIKNAVEPYLARQGIKVAARSTFTCAGGAGDVGAAASQVSGAVLAFRQAGVDRVFVEGIPMVLFAGAAESQGYRPGYLVTSTTNGAALEPNLPASQAANVHGYGWMPEVDVSLTQGPPKTPAQKRCLELLASQDVRPVQYNDFVNAYTTCDGLFLYEQALRATNGGTTQALVTQALNGFATSYSGVGVYSGRSLISAAHRDLPTDYRPWAWSTGCSCFRYTGPERPIS